MDWLYQLDWQSGRWITPAIHGYAVVVFFLTLLVFFVHQSRLVELGRRIGTIAAQIEGRGHPSEPVRLDQMTALILHLGDVVSRQPGVNIRPVLEFLRKEERQRQIIVVGTLVSLTETMIELFPMLGIFGTVWAISGVSAADFGTGRLMVLFGTAVTTTVYALMYVIVFRLAYAAFVQGKVAFLDESNRRFLELLSILERRSGAVDGAGSVPRLISEKTP